jgi:hypothetical protein
MHLSTFFVHRASGAYCGFMVVVLLSKIEEIDTFKFTNLHQNAVKTYLKVSQIYLIKLDTARPRDTRFLVPEKNRAAQNRAL